MNFCLVYALLAGLLVADEREVPGSDYVCRVSVNSGGKPVTSTGFKLDNADGVYTCLHNVAGATTVRVTFKSSFTEMKIAQVDVGRDIAFLVRTGGNQLPHGGLALASATSIEDLKAVESFSIVGFPIGLDAASLTSVNNRLPAVRQLDDVVDRPTSKYLGERGSPVTSTRVLSLQGEVLPGHSGAPVLTRGMGVAGIVSGRLIFNGQQLQHAWAIPLAGLGLKPVAANDPVLDRLALIPMRTDHSLVVNDEVLRNRQKFMLMYALFVESGDGSPVLATKKPAVDVIKGDIDRLKQILDDMKNGGKAFTMEGEFNRQMDNKVFLQSGTRVEAQPNEDSEKGNQNLRPDERMKQFHNVLATIAKQARAMKPA
jgi:hypothetical protein